MMSSQVATVNLQPTASSGSPGVYLCNGKHSSISHKNIIPKVYIVSMLQTGRSRVPFPMR
jgi:hypothetical protein